MWKPTNKDKDKSAAHGDMPKTESATPVSNPQRSGDVSVSQDAEVAQFIAQMKSAAPMASAVRGHDGFRERLGGRDAGCGDAGA